MKIYKKKTKRLKYNDESQELLREFSLLLKDITEYVNRRETYIIHLEKELAESRRIRYMILGILSFIPRKISLLIKSKDNLRK